jgi:hypothetical protein
MKISKAALIASAMLALSTQVFASSTMLSTKTVKTADVDTKAEAYELAFNQLETLQSDSASQLNRALGYIAPDSRSLVLDDGSYITVAEKMNANGEKSYTGLVNVKVSYDMAD